MTKQLMQEVHLRNGASLNNRVVQPPMQTFSGEERGYLSDEGQAYYSARSQSAGLIITEFHYVSDNGGSSTSPGIPEQQAAFSDDYLDSLTQLAKTIKQDGNKAVLQIHHGGREAVTLAAKGENVYAPSAIDFPFIDYSLTELSEEQILDIIKDFGRATSRAI